MKGHALVKTAQQKYYYKKIIPKRPNEAIRNLCVLSHNSITLHLTPKCIKRQHTLIFGNAANNCEQSDTAYMVFSGGASQASIS